MSSPLHLNDLSLDDISAFVCSDSQHPSPSPVTAKVTSKSRHSPPLSRFSYSALPPDLKIIGLSHVDIPRSSMEWSHDTPILSSSSSPPRPLLGLPPSSQQPSHLLHASSSLSLHQLPSFQNHSYLHPSGPKTTKIVHPQPRLARPLHQAQNSFRNASSCSSDSPRPALPLSLIDLIQDCFCLSIGIEPILSPGAYVAEFIDFVAERHCLESLNFLIAVHQYEQAEAQIADTKESSYASSKAALTDNLTNQQDHNDSLNSPEILAQDDSGYPNEGDSLCLCSTLDQGYLSSLWRSIRTNFLLEGASEEINLSQSARDEIANSDICCNSIHLQRAKREVLCLLKENVYMDYFALHRRQAREILPLITAGDHTTKVLPPPTPKQTECVLESVEIQDFSPRPRLYSHSTHTALRHHSGETLREHHHSSAGSSLVSLLSVLKPSSKSTRASPDVESKPSLSKSDLTSHASCETTSGSSFGSLLTVLKLSKNTRVSSDVESRPLPIKSGADIHSCCEVVSGSPRRLWLKKLCHH